VYCTSGDIYRIPWHGAYRGLVLGSVCDILGAIYFGIVLLSPRNTVAKVIITRPLSAAQ
jgi:hypothetical protein